MKNNIGDWKDDITVITSNFKKKDMQATENTIKNIEVEIINNVTRVVKDTGTTGTFVRPGAPVDDIKVEINK